MNALTKSIFNEVQYTRENFLMPLKYNLTNLEEDRDNDNYVLIKNIKNAIAEYEKWEDHYKNWFRIRVKKSKPEYKQDFLINPDKWSFETFLKHREEKGESGLKKYREYLALLTPNREDNARAFINAINNPSLDIDTLVEQFNYYKSNYIQVLKTELATLCPEDNENITYNNIERVWKIYKALCNEQCNEQCNEHLQLTERIYERTFITTYEPEDEGYNNWKMFLNIKK